MSPCRCSESQMIPPASPSTSDLKKKNGFKNSEFYLKKLHTKKIKLIIPVQLHACSAVYIKSLCRESSPKYPSFLKNAPPHPSTFSSCSSQRCLSMHRPFATLSLNRRFASRQLSCAHHIPGPRHRYLVIEILLIWINLEREIIHKN